MQFRKCCIAGVAYGRGITEIGVARMQRLGQEVPVDDEPPVDELKKGRARSESGEPLVNFDGPQLMTAIDSGDKGAHAFFRHLALCHTVVLENVGGETRLSASSPDESALVAAAAHFGYEFVDRHTDRVTVRDRAKGVDRYFEVCTPPLMREHVRRRLTMRHACVRCSMCSSSPRRGGGCPSSCARRGRRRSSCSPRRAPCLPHEEGGLP